MLFQSPVPRSFIGGKPGKTFHAHRARSGSSSTDSIGNAPARMCPIPQWPTAGALPIESLTLSEVETRLSRAPRAPSSATSDNTFSYVIRPGPSPAALLDYGQATAGGEAAPVGLDARLLRRGNRPQPVLNSFLPQRRTSRNRRTPFLPNEPGNRGFLVTPNSLQRRRLGSKRRGPFRACCLTGCLFGTLSAGSIAYPADQGEFNRLGSLNGAFRNRLLTPVSGTNNVQTT
jgi:hypothetical protein